MHTAMIESFYATAREARHTASEFVRWEEVESWEEEDDSETYHERSRQIMRARQEGLTSTYNRFHNPKESAEDIVRLRELLVEMDKAVASAYGWDDLELGHGFHETAQGIRFTISESAQREVLSRLLKLNHERWEEEEKAGLHEKKSKKKGGKKSAREEAQVHRWTDGVVVGEKNLGQQIVKNVFVIDVALSTIRCHAC